MNFSKEGYDGTEFSDFYIRKSPNEGPGWFIFGRNKEKYGTCKNGVGRYIMLCGYRIMGYSRNYNGKVRLGWKTKKEAQAKLKYYLETHPNVPR